jgi:hypothetical protein
VSRQFRASSTRTNEADIWHSANLLIRYHGGDAAFHVALGEIVAVSSAVGPSLIIVKGDDRWAR